MVIYFDDILVYSRSNKEHLSHLREVLAILKENKLYVNLTKCNFMTKKLLFLGFVVSGDGIRWMRRKSRLFENDLPRK